MKKLLPFVMLVALLVACGQLLTPEPAHQPADEVVIRTASYTGSSLIVEFASGTSAAERQALLEAHNLSQSAAIAALNLSFATAAGDLDAAIAALAADPRVKSVEREKLREAGALVNDPRYPDQWALPMIGWDQVYGTINLARTVTIAVLDTGIDASHPDLAANVLPGYSAFGSNPHSDPNGHGTTVAGIAAAAANNGSGIAGVAYTGAKLLPVQVLDEQGLGQDSDIIAGLVWAADQGADVVIMAFSNPGYSPALQAAIDYAWSKGALLVAATGNDGANLDTFPAGSAKVIGVSATNQSDALWSGSNHGDSTFLAAPGVSIVATAKGGGTTSVTGTSASAAIVAGAAALLMASDEDASNGVVAGRLARTADAAGTSTQTGNGRLNLARAFEDDSDEAVVPGGADPAQAGPFVRPYEAAACTLQSVTIGAQTGTLTAGTAGSATYSVTVTKSGGACGPVTLSVADLPQGASGSFSENDFNFSGSPNTRTVTLTINTAASTPAGAMDFTVTASGPTTGGSSIGAPQSGIGTLTIGKADQTITFDPPTSPQTFGATFNVNPTASSGLPVTVTASGVCAVVEAVTGYDVTMTSGTGDCVLTASQGGNDNYNAAPNVERTVAAEKADADITVTGGTFTFDGTAKGASGTATGADGSDLSSLLDLGASFTDVPGGTANWTFPGDNNHHEASGSVQITIEKAATETIVTCPASVNYTGSAIEPCSATVTGPGGLNESLTVVYANNVTAGTATASASYAESANHLGSSHVTTFQILSWWTVDGFYRPVSMTAVNLIRGGSTVPLKFNVYAGAVEITDVSQVQIQVHGMTCDHWLPTETIEDATATGGTSLRYDAKEGQFIFNWQSPRAANRCYEVVMTAADGTMISSLFRTR